MRVAKLHTDQTVDESQSSHGVWGNLDRITSSYTAVVWELGWGGIAIDWVTLRWRFWHKYLPLMYSQATVRSYTKDGAVLRWDHTLERRLGVFPALKRYFSSIRNFSSIPKVFFQHPGFFQHLNWIFSSIQKVFFQHLRFAQHLDVVSKI